MDKKFKSTKTISILGILANIFLLIIKAIIGIITRSQAMIADSMNSGTDIFASLMTFIGNKISSEPHDRSHNLGHGKAEYIFSLFISISMIIFSLKLLYDSIVSLVLGNSFSFSWVLVIVSIITIIIKGLLYLYTKKIYSKHPSILLYANMKDHRNDTIITLFTLISILFGLFDVFWLDNITGILISVWICYTGIKIFIESFNVLMDISIDDKTLEKIETILSENTNVLSVKNILSTPVGDCHLIFVTITVDGNMTTFKSHELADTLENTITCLNNVYKTVVHVEPHI